VWQQILAIGAVAELARVQRGGDGLNSGEFIETLKLYKAPTDPVSVEAMIGC